ncbi:hypothetical protein H5410_024457 [Solanum commersonii]|uniref:DUF4371 domain-containing protein n=1 Tax=Solanum commersonii TaxID=4109 RepID=A0A9J5ZM25_SOLCO|nr:hypothetical protein H5410_024457 [Solanum commersonii]
MDKYVIRSKIGYQVLALLIHLPGFNHSFENSKQNIYSDVDLESLEVIGIRKPIAEYNLIYVMILGDIIFLKPCQPKDHKFPKTKFGKKSCRGYMVDAAFTKTGYRAWNKATERFRAHVGHINSIHNKCFNKMLDLMNQSQSIRTFFDKKSKKEKSESRHRLSALIDVARFLLKLGLSFRGHDESRSSSNRGIFLELLQWYGDINEDLTLVAIVKKDSNVDDFFCLVTNVLNIVGASFKRRDLLRKHQVEQLEELLISEEVHIGLRIKSRSVGRTLDNLIVLFPSVIHVRISLDASVQTILIDFLLKLLWITIKKFDFAFMLHLMWKVLMMTNELNFSLQRMDQDIVNAM